LYLLLTNLLLICKLKVNIVFTTRFWICSSSSAFFAYDFYVLQSWSSSFVSKCFA
jgi:hypothetical protein